MPHLSWKKKKPQRFRAAVVRSRPHLLGRLDLDGSNGHVHLHHQFGMVENPINNLLVLSREWMGMGEWDYH